MKRLHLASAVFAIATLGAVGGAVGGFFVCSSRVDCTWTDLPSGVLVLCPGKKAGLLSTNSSFLTAEFGEDWAEQELSQKTRVGLISGGRFHRIDNSTFIAAFGVPREFKGRWEPGWFVDVDIYSIRTGKLVSLHVLPHERKVEVFSRRQRDPRAITTFPDGSVRLDAGMTGPDRPGGSTP